MSTVHDTTNLKPYKSGNLPKLEDGLLPFLSRELSTVSASLNATIAALKLIEARLVAGGL
jgi:hypothetical protein